ncbi:hypothetical protein [Mangrovicoccus algicola]|uniref:Uncharacterized protein n=1 Tax=Mangrovicoccus algicola TaxID=2771008 RepID=A0A8J6YPG7_9RHOB|nr:hypothetical protein [Mangrovicoccus algicola]MBE3636978.1 hypothetical protein [Mangrovicoccus algicola]
MGYRDDFYKVYNIYGYTGDLRARPSVYFLTDTHFGRITQHHADAANIGRMSVCETDMVGHHYFIENQSDRTGREVAVEEFRHPTNGATIHIHTSRNPITVVRDWDKDQLTPRVLALLAASITNFQDLKVCERPGYRG